MELNVLKNVERKKNLMMFIVNAVVPIAGFVYVMLFIHGTIRDSVVLLMTVASLLVRLFEEKLGRFAKYVYVSIMPFFGAVTIAVGADGKFGAITQCYFFVLLIAIGYYDISVLRVKAVVTVISNIIGMIIFPKSFLQMHSWIIWIFIGIVYFLAVLGAIMTAKETYELFAKVEDKGNSSGSTCTLCCASTYESVN